MFLTNCKWPQIVSNTSANFHTCNYKDKTLYMWDSAVMDHDGWHCSNGKLYSYIIKQEEDLAITVNF